MWKYFTTEDFARRRTALMEKFPNGVAILVGAELPEADVKFRQDNTFYYFTGVEIPDAEFLLNGKTPKASLFVPDEKKIHLHLEDTFAVTENGAENLTSSAPSEPEAIYNLIREKGLWGK